MAMAGLFCLAGAAAGTAAPALWLQLGLLALVLALPIGAVLRRVESEAIPRERSAAAATSLPRGATGLIISYAAFGFGYILPATFLPVMARSVVDDPMLFGLAWPVFGMMAVLSNIGAGWCLRHASRLQVWAGAHFLMGLGVVLPSLWLNGWTIALAALLVGGTFMAVTMTAVQESRARAPHNPTAFVSRMTAGFAVGQIAGPVCSSLLLYLPSARAQGLNIALQAAAAGLLLSAAWLWREHQKNSHLAVAV
jgi:predicted MFS family arabinose efflux permease